VTNDRIIPWAFVVLLAALTIASPSVAQRGWVSGSVVDSTGASLAYANVWIEGSHLGAMTDKSGAFRFDAPAGRHSVKVGFWYRSVRCEISVTPGEDTELHIVLDEQPALPPESRIVDVPVKPRSGHVTEDQIGQVELYPETSDPVRSGSLEFVMRRTIRERGDSTLVSINAEGRNVTDSETSVCGCLSFWDVRYEFEPEVIDSVRAILWVNTQECGSRMFECESVVLAPGETVTKGLSFAYDTRALPSCTGEVRVTAAFFQGTAGMAWADTRCLVIGPLPILVKSASRSPQQ
jgi:hypothetical protein